MPEEPVREDPCLRKPCGRNAYCVAQGYESFKCICETGYSGNPELGCFRECEHNNDCPDFLACVNYKCTDPCQGTCGINALCETRNHLPRCTCPPGYSGNPLQNCFRYVGEYPMLPKTSAFSEANVEYFIAEPERARVECTRDSECALTHACVNNDCIEACIAYKVCAPNAICTSIQHRAVCSCPQGYDGNAQYECREREYFFEKSLFQPHWQP